MKDYVILNRRGMVIGNASAKSEGAAVEGWNAANPAAREYAAEAYCRADAVAGWNDCEEPRDIVQWQTPPNRQGQIVLVSYATGGDNCDVLYRRTWDQSDGTRTYAKRFLRDDESFEPWNTEPE